MDRFYTTANTPSDDCSFTNTATAQGYYIPQSGADPVIVSGEDSVTLGCIFADIVKTADKETVVPAALF